MFRVYNGMLVAAIYEDDGRKMLMSVTADVTTEDEMVTVAFAEELPEHFYLRAYIVDYDLSPLSEVYEWSKNSRPKNGGAVFLTLSPLLNLK
ncbi:MAG: hypothetical protein K5686_08960 [Lachnospiraceae bacterium]|nr:hypothetical protein [Lachnospiraceae bacterium]